jgi:hypothetical protein
MATNVKARVTLNARVCVINSVTEHTTHGPKEGAQWHNIHHCVTKSITLGDWIWRYETAKQILCSGITDNGLYYGQVIGNVYV